jgi:hypothetical protein
LLEQAGVAAPADDSFEVIDALYAYGRSHGAAWPEIREIEKRNARQVSWEQVRERAGFADLATVNHALLTGIGALREKYSDPAADERLRAFCDATKIDRPTEGDVEPLMEEGIIELFRRARLDRVEHISEFGDKTAELAVSALPDAWQDFEMRRASLCALDRSLLVTIHWDSFFTLITGTPARLAAADPATLFEGFWCKPTTSHHWWKERAGWVPPAPDH